MATAAVEGLAALLTPGKTIAGLDLGTKTIGVAISDRGLSLATPRPVIRRTKFTADAQALLALLAKDNAGAIVLGLPLNMDGSEGPRAQATRAFARNLEKMTDLPIAFWDERLSTVAAERSLIEMDVSRAKRADRIDFGRCGLHPAGRAGPDLFGGKLSRLDAGLFLAGGSRLARRPPFANLAALAEGNDAGDQEGVEDAGLEKQARDRRRIDAEDLPVDLEHQVVQFAAQEQHAEVDVVIGQAEPAPEQNERHEPEPEKIAHQTGSRSMSARPAAVRRALVTAR